MTMNESTRRRVFRIRKLAERIESERGRDGIELNGLTLDAFELAKLVREWLSEAPGAANVEATLSEHASRISLLERFANELRREDVGHRLAKLEFRAEDNGPAPDASPLDRRPDVGEVWRAPGITWTRIDGNMWLSPDYTWWGPDARTRRQLVQDGLRAAGKDEP